MILKDDDFMKIIKHKEYVEQYYHNKNDNLF